MKKLMLLMLAMAGMSTMANAELIHRYEFNDGVTDSIGSADGTLGDIGVVTGGALVTDGTASPANVTGGAGLPLSAIAEIDTAFTIESWTEGFIEGNWQGIFAFTASNQTNYIIACADRGDAPDNNWGADIRVDGASSLIYGDNLIGSTGPQQLVLSFDGTSFRTYNNGTLIQTVEKANFDLKSFTNLIGINCGSAWQDPTYNGKTLDFRIYNDALTDDQVSDIFAYGADASNNALIANTSQTAWGASPANGDTLVGDVNANEKVTLTMSWKTALDPANPENPNPAVIEHHLYMSPDHNTASDPNLVYVSTFAATGDGASVTFDDLNLDGIYTWRIDEALTDNGPGDPNVETGKLWYFETQASVPVITDQPDFTLAPVGGTAEMTISSQSISEQAYTWYYTPDDSTETPEDDVIVDSGSATMTLDGITTDNQGYYYCSVVNESNIPVLSNTALMEVEQLVAYYAFEDDTTDETGNYDGAAYYTEYPADADPIITETTMSYTTGKVGNAIQYIADENKHVEIACMVRHNYTIEMWVKTTPDVTGGTGGWWEGRGLVDGEMGGFVPDFGTVVRGSGFGYGTGSDGTTISSGKVINDDVWHYCVATRDLDSGDMKVYVDGQLEAAATANAGTVATDSTALSIGKILEGQNYYVGALDEIKIYNYPMDEMTIAQNYHALNPDDDICIQSLKPDTMFDLHEDCRVDILDFAVFAGHWLDCAQYPDCFDME